MEKSLLMKVAAAAVGTAVVAGVVIAVSRLSQNADSYRSILVYEVEGTAQIDRAAAGVMNAAENLYLESGDVLTVQADSFMRLRLDDDKYVMVEENSVFSVEATGSKEDSKTRINLTQGAIVNEIQNPLSAGSTYEVTTPNSIMAVRGTIFRVEILFDENGEVYTKLSAYEGKVVSRLIYPDGTMDDEVSVEAGNEVIIHSNDTLTEYLKPAGAIEYEELPLQTLYVLQDIMDNGDIIQGLTREELEELIRRLRRGDESDDDAGGSGRPQADQEDGVSQTAVTVEGTENSHTEESHAEPAETTRWQEPMERNAPEESTYTQRQTETLQALESTTQTETSKTSETIPQTSEETSPQPSRSGSSSGGSSGGGRRPRPTESSPENSTERPTESETPTERPTEPDTSPERPTESETPTERPTEPDTSPERPTESETPTESIPESENPSESTEESESTTQAAVYTVTFTYQGEEVGIQQVESGSCAVRPRLNPAASGGWDFDFSTAIVEDTEISWN